MAPDDKAAPGPQTGPTAAEIAHLQQAIAALCLDIEMRDTQEAQTVAMAIDYIYQGHLHHAMDVLTMRLVALTRARARGGSSEVAQRGEVQAETVADTSEVRVASSPSGKKTGRGSASSATFREALIQAGYEMDVEDRPWWWIDQVKKGGILQCFGFIVPTDLAKLAAVCVCFADDIYPEEPPVRRPKRRCMRPCCFTGTPL